MRQISILILLIFSHCTFSDSASESNQGEPFEAATATFSAYLKNNFNQNIPIPVHYYLILPATGACHGCTKASLNLFMPLKNRKDLTLLTSAVPDLQGLTIPADHLATVLIDSVGNIDKIDLPIPTTNGILKTRNQKIEEIITIEASNIEQVFRDLAQR